MHFNVPKTFHMAFHIFMWKSMDFNVLKIFHMMFHMNYHVKVKHYDQIIIKLWKSTNK
jgi:hypothetical protein